MSKRLVKVGDYVKQGDVIGKVGMTGNSGGPHVCYRFWKNGRQVDPFKQKLPAAKPLKKSIKTKYLAFIETPKTSFASDCGLGFGVLFVNGHTEKQMIPHISYRGKTLVFMADLLPTAGHLPLPYIMGYDVRPLQTLEEKKRFLSRAADENFVLFMQHDANNPLITVQHTDKGVRLHESLATETLNTF